MKNVKVGMTFRTHSKQFKSTNYAHVTKIFPKSGHDHFYVIFVDPKNFKKKRLYTDREICVWDYIYSGKLADRWERVTRRR